VNYFFFSVFSIFAFNPARISLLSPRVEAGALFEATASATALTFFSSSSLKIAV
jgi:hypothetical protein